MNDIEHMASLIAKKGKINIYYRGETPYLSVRITLPKDSKSAEFARYFKEEYCAGAIQEFKTTMVFIMMNRQAERFIFEQDVFDTLLDEPSFMHIGNYLNTFQDLMELKRSNNPIYDPEDMKELAEKLRVANGSKARGGRGDIQEAIQRAKQNEVDPRFLEDENDS